MVVNPNLQNRFNQIQNSRDINQLRTLQTDFENEAQRLRQEALQLERVRRDRLQEQELRQIRADMKRAQDFARDIKKRTRNIRGVTIGRPEVNISASLSNSGVETITTRRNGKVIRKTITRPQQKTIKPISEQRFTQSVKTPLKEALKNNNKKQVSEILNVRQKNLSSNYSPGDINTILKAKNKSQAINALKEIAKREREADKQRLREFLKISPQEIKTEKQAKQLQKDISREFDRQENISKNEKLKAQILLNDAKNKAKLLKTTNDLNTLKLSKLISGGNPTQTKEFYNLIKNQKVLSAQEKAKLKKELLDIPIDTFKAGKWVVLATKELLSPKSLISGAKLGNKGLENLYDYGGNLVKRGLWTKGKNNPLIKDFISKPIKKFQEGSLKANDLKEFVKRNPEATAILVGAAAVNLQTNFKSDFNKNPSEALLRSIATWYAPNIAVSGVPKIIKGTKGVSNILTQIRNNKALKKVIDKAKLGELTPKQIKQLDKKFNKAVKVSEIKKRDEIIKSGLIFILKERGIKPRRNASINQLANQVKASKVQQIKLLSRKSLPKKKIIKKTDKIKLSDLKKTDILLSNKKVVVVKNKNKRQNITRFKVNKNGTLTRISKKEFDKITSKAIKKKVIKKTELKEINIKSLSNTVLENKLENQGIVKLGGITYIDLNAVKRIENTKIPIKVTTRKAIFRSKKAQFDYTRLFSNQINKENVRIKKILNKSKKTTIKKDLNNTKLRLLKLRKLLINSSSLITQSSNLIKVIDDLLKRISILDKFISKIPVKDLSKIINTIDKKTNVSIIDSNFSNLSATSSLKGQSVSSLNKFVQKVIKSPKKVLKVSKTPPKKPRRIPTLRLNIKNLPKKGSRQGYLVRIKEGNKIVSQTNVLLPKNRATNFGRKRVDSSLRASFDVVPKGKTPIVDVKNTQLTNKFRVKRSKGTKVLTNVEKKKFRLDKAGEKKEAKNKRIKSKSIKKSKKKPKKSRKKK